MACFKSVVASNSDIKERVCRRVPLSQAVWALSPDLRHREVSMPSSGKVSNAMQCNAFFRKGQGLRETGGRENIAAFDNEFSCWRKGGLDCYKMSTTYFPSGQFALVFVHSTKEHIGIMTNKTMFSTQIYHNAQFCAQLTHPHQWSPG